MIGKYGIGKGKVSILVFYVYVVVVYNFCFCDGYIRSVGIYYGWMMVFCVVCVKILVIVYIIIDG